MPTPSSQRHPVFSKEHVIIRDTSNWRSRLCFYRDALLIAITRLINEGLTQSASSLAYTSITSAVPLLAVVLSLFTAFPIFNEFKVYLDQFLTANLFPETISGQIIEYLNVFAEAATQLTAIGTVFLFVTSIMLMMTIETALNRIFNVNKSRPLTHRILIYWAVLSVGPLAFAMSLWASALIVSHHLVSGFSVLSGLLSFFAPLLLSGLMLSLLYYVIPNRTIRFKDAAVGGYVAAILFELVRFGFTLYLSYFPSYTLIYGAFAILPIFLIWVYTSWLIVLLGAYITALMPQVRRGVIVRSAQSGALLLLAINILRQLHAHRCAHQGGLTDSQLLDQLSTDHHHLQTTLTTLSDLGYVAPTTGRRQPEWLLACDTEYSITPLIDYFLFDRQADQVMADRKLHEALVRTLQKDEVPLSQVL